MTRAMLTVETVSEATDMLADVEACERAVFFGVWRVVHLSGEGAENDFRAAEKVCPLDSIEASETRVELARLKEVADQ